MEVRSVKQSGISKSWRQYSVLRYWGVYNFGCKLLRGRIQVIRELCYWVMLAECPLVSQRYIVIAEIFSKRGNMEKSFGLLFVLRTCIKLWFYYIYVCYTYLFTRVLWYLWFLLHLYILYIFIYTCFIILVIFTIFI